MSDYIAQRTTCRKGINSIAQDAFPQPRKIGTISAWRSSEIQAWIDALPVGIDKGIGKAA